MPGLYPQQTYPFALQFLSFFGSLFFTIYEDRWMRVETQIICFFAIQAVGLSIIPFLANIGDDLGYWSVFITLVITGWFGGIAQGAVYRENAKLPGDYIGIFLTS